MANFIGKKITLFGKTFDFFNEEAVGTPDIDWIEMHGGHDKIWGNGGADHILAGDGDDQIWATNSGVAGAWGEDFVAGGDGNDIIDYTLNTDRVTVYGGEGTDTIKGGSGNDYIEGNEDDDHLFGNSGDDVIAGGSGDDTIEGGAGNDLILGDSYLDGNNDDGVDTLSGNGGYDTFMFNMINGWTESDKWNPDTIKDFWWYYDAIMMPVAGTSANYIETALGYNVGYLDAMNWAETHMSGDDRYAFVTDGVNGYLFGDLNGNGTVETGIVLEGKTTINAFGYWDIIAGGWLA